ncbi:DUF397 domain-containing protein [Plantactinospora sp. CA-290183]|uniref:DUF397 domain-containing protein n=1 Tax=Plantactinospora sp. CA-290183 TaxID=3240006 RepID=UPI003D8B7564
MEAVRWRKSSRSGGADNCVEVADGAPGPVGVRDSKDRRGPELAFDRADWRAFVAAVKGRAPR